MNVVFIGCGNMGTALLRASLSISDIDDIYVIEKRKEQRDRLKEMDSRLVLSDKIEVLPENSLVIFAVKPQDMEAAVREAFPYINNAKDIAILSIAAGITVDYYKKQLSNDIPIFRVMPNTPGLVSAGVSGVFCSEKDKEFWPVAHKIISGLGEVVEVKEEKLIDVITAVSGSGPAYFFLLTEMLAEYAVQNGLTKGQADLLARRTCYGAGILLERFGLSPKELREMVTSKKGTTEAAIKTMLKSGIRDILFSGFSAAEKRAKELSL